MKKYFALFLGLLMIWTCVSACAETAAQPERYPASYFYALPEGGGEYIENLIFNEDVVISGENAQVIFSNCEFNANIILTAEAATRVLLLGCDVNGACVFQNNIKEATLEYSFPKFLTDTPVTALCEDCSGTLIALGDFEVSLNGQTYTMADCEFFNDVTAPENGMVPYEGQNASYYCIAQWQENGQQATMVICEFDPEM